MNRNIFTFIGCESEYSGARIVLFGAPFDSTTSYRPGTRFASGAMRSASVAIETYSPYQDKDLSDMAVFDGGDLELCFGNTEKALDQIEAFTGQVLNDNKIPCMIGGEHLVALGAIRAAFKKHPGLNVLHFDAHADLRDAYLGEKLSHATVMRRVWDLVGDGRIYQFGIRSGCREELAWGKGRVFTNMYDFSNLRETVDKLYGSPVYLSVDLDVLDPSVFPGTGTPEAGGVSFLQLLDAILLTSGLHIVGLDVNELSPVHDQSESSTLVACKLLRELLLLHCK
ncbi:MAG: agmatinase [Bacillota bacterium]